MSVKKRRYNDSYIEYRLTRINNGEIKNTSVRDMQ